MTAPDSIVAPVAELRSVIHRYEPGHDVLAGIDLALQPGESVAVRGRSGAGKSTLISILALLLRPTAGSVLIDGIDCGQAADRDLVALRRDRIGFVFQSANLLDAQPVWRSVALPLRIAGLEPRTVRARVDEVLAAVGLDGLGDRRPAELSGGQRHRVAIARALGGRPRLLIADEPTASLDEETGDAVAELLFERTRSAGCALVLATHDRRLAGLADRRIELAGGHLAPDPIDGRPNA